ncbi:MAG: hypothetical protein Q9169_004957 [Polycauliona sp. 2 TL-2023]
MFECEQLLHSLRNQTNPSSKQQKTPHNTLGLALSSAANKIAMTGMRNVVQDIIAKVSGQVRILDETNLRASDQYAQLEDMFFTNPLLAQARVVGPVIYMEVQSLFSPGRTLTITWDNVQDHLYDSSVSQNSDDDSHVAENGREEDGTSDRGQT